MEQAEAGDCFVIMPISDPEGYLDGHFAQVYEDIIAPACRSAGFRPVRADDVKSTNLIHLDILTKLLDAPLAVCDLSSLNPNVMFELGLRQAFDKPVVLIQEKGTRRIFDISPLRVLDYSRELKYRDVLQTQQALSQTITATMEGSRIAGHVNSIVKLLGLQQSAAIPDVARDREELTLDVLTSEVRGLRRMMEGMASGELSRIVTDGTSTGQLLDRLTRRVQRIRDELPLAERKLALEEMMKQVKNVQASTSQSQSFARASMLANTISRYIDECQLGISKAD